MVINVRVELLLDSKTQYTPKLMRKNIIKHTYFQLQNVERDEKVKKNTPCFNLNPILYTVSKIYKHYYLILENSF